MPRTSLTFQRIDGTAIGPVSVGYPGPLDHDDAESEPLREDSLAVAQQLPRADLNRDDGRE